MPKGTRQPKPRARQPSAGQIPTAQNNHGHQQQQQLPSLPEAVLATILQHVPLRDRLSACTLVCKSWAVAVACTTADVKEFIRGPDRCRHVQEWLELCGEQVSSLDLIYSMEHTMRYDEEANPFKCRLLLPCSKLTRLTSLSLAEFPVAFHTQQHASGVSTRSRPRASTAQSLAVAASSSSGKGGCVSKLRMRPAGSIPAAAGGATAGFLPALRHLLLSHCKIRYDSFLQLSQLTHLTSLHLHRVVLCTAAWAPVAEPQARKAFTTILQQLQGLESLNLGDNVVLQDSPAALSALSTMQRLQQLNLNTEVCSTAAHLAHFPTGLTRLELVGDVSDEYADSGFLRLTTSALPQLPMLRAVLLDWVELDPGVLACWSRLTELMLSNVMPQDPAIAADEPDDSEGDEELQERQIGAFLGELGKLTELQELSLHSMYLHNVQDVQLFTALTASTQLTLLEVTAGSADEPGDGGSVPLPLGALQHMFSLPKQWPLLQTLRILVDTNDDDCWDVEDWCVDASDIGRLASCLPALDTLLLLHVLKDLDTVDALTQLMPGLTKLAVGGDGCEDEAAHLVSKLTSLRALEWVDADVTPDGLQALTALTNLDELLVVDCPSISEHVLNTEADHGDDMIELYTSDEAEAAGKSDVWQQLQELCTALPWLSESD